MEPRISASMELFDMFNSGETFLKNPITEPAAEATTLTTGLRDQVSAQMDLMDPADDSFPVLRSLKACLDDSTTQVNALDTHAQTMIFGDSSGSVISGGLNSNLGTAMSALKLNNSMAALGQSPQGTTSPSDPCAMISDFFETLIGKGQELIGQIQAAVQEALAPVQELINKINTAITTGLQALRDAITEITAKIQAAVSEITEAIAAELANFAKWLNLLFNFNLASFLAGIFDNSCARLLVNAVTSPAGQMVLSQTLSGTPRPTRPRIGPLF